MVALPARGEFGVRVHAPDDVECPRFVQALIKVDADDSITVEDETKVIRYPESVCISTPGRGVGAGCGSSRAGVVRCLRGYLANVPDDPTVEVFEFLRN